MRREKFRHGDLVRVSDDLGPAMAHFLGKGKRAIVLGSYRDQYGGREERNAHQYTLFIEGEGQSSWYDEEQLTLLEANAVSLLDSWEEQREARVRDESSLPWIVTHWPSLRDSCPTNSLLALFRAIGHESAFLRNGEYYCLQVDYERLFPMLDMLVTCKSLEELRSHKVNDEVDTTAVDEAWQRIHAGGEA